MEADLFQDILSALQQQKNLIRLSLANPCPVQKVIWSSFDYLRGPELEFVWEADYSPTSSEKHQFSAGSVENSQQQKRRANGADSNTFILEDNETVAEASNSSTDSSFSKNTGPSDASTAQYEEIDDHYNSKLLQLSGDIFQNGTHLIASSSMSEHSACGTSHQHLTDELSSLNLSCQTDETLRAVPAPLASQPKLVAAVSVDIDHVKDEEDGDGPPIDGEEVVAVTEGNFDAGNATNTPPLISGDAMVTSCVDSGIGGTISIESNLSTYTKQENGRKDEVLFNVDDQRCSIKMRTNNRSEVFGCHIPEAEEVIEFKPSYADSSSTSNPNSPRIHSNSGRRTETQHNEQTAGCCSSSMFSSFNVESVPTKSGMERTQPKWESERLEQFYREAEQFASEFAPSDPSAGGDGLTDEAFVAKHVLAEQIGSIQFSSNPVLHKFCLVPSRHFCVGSFIFATRRADQSRTVTNTLCAFSVVIPLNKSDWYLRRHSIFAEMFSDVIARFKAASLVESVEDLVCRCTREFMPLFLLFGALERWPLVTNCEQTHLRIQHSHLWELNPVPNSDFLARCITACLMCRGRCAIVGGKPPEVAQLMHTLVAFMQPSDRLFCLRPYKMQFSPYLRLQAIKRPELYQFVDKVFSAHWSSALLDIDRRTVSFTGLYHTKHRAQKMRFQRCQIGQILREASDAGAEVPWHLLYEMERWTEVDNGTAEDILDSQNVQADPSVKELLSLIHLMPLNRPARIAFVDHFHLRIDNRAKALIAYVRDLSVPPPGDKRSALSSKWHLIAVRRNLNFISDASFGVALARADSLEPEFAEFIAQKTDSDKMFNPNINDWSTQL